MLLFEAIHAHNICKYYIYYYIFIYSYTMLRTLYMYIMYISFETYTHMYMFTLPLNITFTWVFPKIGIYPKMDGFYNGKPTIFGNIHISVNQKTYHPILCYSFFAHFRVHPDFSTLVGKTHVLMQGVIYFFFSTNLHRKKRQKNDGCFQYALKKKPWF